MNGIETECSPSRQHHPKRPDRVMHMSQPVDGGTATVVADLAKVDLAQGRSVTIVSPPGQLEQWALEHPVAWVNLPLVRNPSYRDLTAIRTVRKLLFEVDLACLHSSKAGAIGRVAMSTIQRSERPKCVFYPHAWSWYVGGSTAILYRAFERRAARWADAIVAVSHREVEDGRRLLSPGDATKIVLIENGVDTVAYSPEGAAAPRGDDPLVVCVGRLCRQKGQDALIRAMGMLEDRSVRLSLVGEGPDEEKLRRLADEYGLADRVAFVGSADPRPYYRAADVVVIPSRWEGLPLVLLEAMACGGAVLATRAAAANLSDDSGIISSENTEPEVLARDLTAMLREGALLDGYRDRARRTAEKSYSERRVADLYDALVGSLLTNDRSIDSEEVAPGGGPG